MTKKYELTNNTINYFGKTLYRIRALRDFEHIKKGDLGGYIEQENNLSHEGNCWIYDNAEIFGDAKVYGNAKVFGNAWVSDNVKIFGNAEVFGNDEIPKATTTINKTINSCQHTNKYINSAGGTAFWFCRDCKEDLGDVK